MVETRRNKKLENAYQLAVDGAAGYGINDRINNDRRAAIKTADKDMGMDGVDVDEDWRRYYRNKLEEERFAHGRTIFHRIARRLWLVQYHFFISMGHFLFDTWEAVVYTVLFFTIVYVMLLALLRSWPLTWAFSKVQVLLNSNVNVDELRTMTL